VTDGRIRQNRVDPFRNQFALHLGEAGHDVKEEAAGGCLGVDAVRQAAEVYFARLERVHEIHEPFCAPPQAIQLPNDQRVTGTQVRPCIIEARANQLRAAEVTPSRAARCSTPILAQMLASEPVRRSRYSSSY